jgi:hypothetical protein
MTADMIQTPQKKALLVGICYEENEATVPSLQGPHGGVLELKKVLIGMYCYTCLGYSMTYYLSYRALRLCRRGYCGYAGQFHGTE